MAKQLEKDEYNDTENKTNSRRTQTYKPKQPKRQRNKEGKRYQLKSRKRNLLRKEALSNDASKLKRLERLYDKGKSK